MRGPGAGRFRIVTEVCSRLDSWQLGQPEGNVHPGAGSAGGVENRCPLGHHLGLISEQRCDFTKHQASDFSLLSTPQNHIIPLIIRLLLLTS